MALNGIRVDMELAALRRRHGVALVVPRDIPLSSPVEGDVIVEGLCSTSCCDLMRTVIKDRALRWDKVADVKLLVSHDHDRVAGEILDLRHTADGTWIKARVRDPEGKRMGGFSIGGPVDDYRLLNENRPDFVAEMRRITLREVSMSSRPTNPEALVKKRYAVPADMRTFDAYFKSRRTEIDLFISAFDALARQLQLVGTMLAKRANSETASRPRSPSPFSSLVTAMQERA